MAKTYKTIKGALKFLGEFALQQDMSECSDWDMLSKEQQSMFYGLLAGLQNDLSDLQRTFDSMENNKIVFYKG